MFFTDRFTLALFVLLLKNLPIAGVHDAAVSQCFPAVRTAERIMKQIREQSGICMTEQATTAAHIFKYKQACFRAFSESSGAAKTKPPVTAGRKLSVSSPG